MSKPKIVVAVLGVGRVLDVLVKRIGQRADLALGAVLAAEAEPSSDVDCVLYLPAVAELADGRAAQRIIALLRAGFDVVSTVPPAALDDADWRSACREGGSTFHGTGGFQSSLIARFNRAFASITRNIRDVELTEELDFDEFPPHPWSARAETGVGDKDPHTVAARVATIEHYYDAGLHTLAEAVFGQDQSAEKVVFSASSVSPKSEDKRGRKEASNMLEQVVVRRALGDALAYDSVWTSRHESAVPLRYRLRTASADAMGQVTISFHAESEVHPADHLICVGLLDAVRPAYESNPGVLRHDLEINHVKTDKRLAL